MNNKSLRLCAVNISKHIGLYQFAVRIDTHFRNKSLAKAFHKDGLSTLCIAHDVLNDAGILYFPTCGTLLGAYRNHDFIPYDCDLDCGVLVQTPDTPQRVQDILKKAGYTHTVQFYFKETNKIVFDRFTRLGVQLDLFYYFEEGEHYCTYFAHRHETKDWREANLTDGFPTHKSYMEKGDFEKREFLGHMLYMPTNTEAWLRDMYGPDFMTPLPNWERSEHKTTTVDEGERVYRRTFTEGRI